MNGTWSVIRNAPFGTSYTPDTARLKIMDGKMVSVDDNDEQKLVNSRLDRYYRSNLFVIIISVMATESRVSSRSTCIM